MQTIWGFEIDSEDGACESLLRCLHDSVNDLVSTAYSGPSTHTRHFDEKVEVSGRVLAALEMCMFHGLLVPQGARPEETDFWPFAKGLKDINGLVFGPFVDNAMSLSLPTGRATCRAWLRALLNEGACEYNLLALFGEAEVLRKAYRPSALVSSAAWRTQVVEAVARLNDLCFDFSVDDVCGAIPAPPPHSHLHELLQSRSVKPTEVTAAAHGCLTVLEVSGAGVGSCNGSYHESAVEAMRFESAEGYEIFRILVTETSPTTPVQCRWFLGHPGMKKAFYCCAVAEEIDRVPRDGWVSVFGKGPPPVVVSCVPPLVAPADGSTPVSARPTGLFLDLESPAVTEVPEIISPFSDKEWSKRPSLASHRDFKADDAAELVERANRQRYVLERARLRRRIDDLRRLRSAADKPGPRGDKAERLEEGDAVNEGKSEISEEEKAASLAPSPTAMTISNTDAGPMPAGGQSRPRIEISINGSEIVRVRRPTRATGQAGDQLSASQAMPQQHVTYIVTVKVPAGPGVRAGGCEAVEWRVCARYSLFKVLHADLAACYPYLLGSQPGLPPLPAASLFRSFDPAYIESQRASLEGYMRALAELYHQGLIGDSSVADINRVSAGQAIPEAGDPFITFLKGRSDTDTLAKGCRITPGGGLHLCLELSKPTASHLQDSLRLAMQDYACAGCGNYIRSGLSSWFSKRYRLCEYSQLYFCLDCHVGGSWVLPWRVLHHWDFTPMPVAELSLSYLAAIHNSPVLCVSAINPQLFETTPALSECRRLRLQLGYMRECMVGCHELRSCEVVLGDRLHLMHNTEMFSLQDLIDVTNNSMALLLAPLVQRMGCHIREDCGTCGSSASCCSICNSPEPVHAFDIDTTTQCRGCLAWLHKECYVRRLAESEAWPVEEGSLCLSCRIPRIPASVVEPGLE